MIIVHCCSSSSSSSLCSRCSLFLQYIDILRCDLKSVYQYVVVIHEIDLNQTYY
uniref:Uncharacterized protein n=1 Tax=Schistosoma curassoni TaxID=6186 RepID=A0A183JDF0_9TREM